MDITSNSESFAQNERLLYAQFRRKISSEAAHAQIKKLEYDLADAKTGYSSLKTACADASALGIGGVCVLPNLVKRCSSMLGNNRRCQLVARVGSDGGDTTAIKVKALKQALKEGADAVEVTAPTAFVRDGNFAYVKKEFKKLRSAAKRKSLRITLNCSILTRDEIKRTAAIAVDCGANAVCLTGTNGVDNVTAVKSAVKDKCLIKAEGSATVLEMSGSVDLGASVIGSKNAAEVARAIITAAEVDY